MSEAVAAVKAQMESERADVKARIIAALKEDGEATTTALRGLFERYEAHPHKHPVFWARLSELEKAHVIKRVGSKKMQHWEFPETVWGLAS